MQAGAWQRLAWMLLAVTVAVSMCLAFTWLVGSVSKFRLVTVGIAFTVVVSLESYAFLRFRHVVRDRQRTESQQQHEAGLHWLPMLVVVIICIKTEQSWDSADNLFIVVFAIILLY